MDANKARIAVIGLGYVGLPLAVEFAKHVEVIGFDIDEERIRQLVNGEDRTLEVEPIQLAAAAESIRYTSEASALNEADTYIVTTPTPIDAHKRPNLRPLTTATQTIANALNRGDVVIYESTVYPGATEEVCVPILEKISGLSYNVDFFVGYSPERINPGDKKHRLPDIVKVTSGSNPRIADYIDSVYRLIIRAGTFQASSIRVAEAAKVIENTQRDVNIALVNELAVLFSKLGIDTEEVLSAAGTKWNFLPFRPGLVGGHCIGVDPYYLTYKAQEVGHNPEIILAGRRLNDSMGSHVASELVKAMLKSGQKVSQGRVLILGLTFKENTPDLRNTRIVDVVRELEDYGLSVDVHDPWADAGRAFAEHKIRLINEPLRGHYDGVVIAVAHEEFRSKGAEWIGSLRNSPQSIVYDLKCVLDRDESDLRL